MDCAARPRCRAGRSRRSQHSTLREKVVEHLFLAELSKEMLLRAKTPFEVLRSEFDGHGYDIVVEAKGVLRHIQFKHSRADSKVRRQKVNVALTQKPGGCVIWSMVDRSTMGVGPFFWLGGKPGQALSNIGNKVARHTKGDQTGHKAPREAIRIVNQGQFQRIESMAALAICLFGDIYGPLANISEKEKEFWLSLPPTERRWAQKTYFPVGIPSSQRSEEHKSELQSLMRISYAVSCLKYNT